MMSACMASTTPTTLTQPTEPPSPRLGLHQHDLCPLATHILIYVHNTFPNTYPQCTMWQAEQHGKCCMQNDQQLQANTNLLFNTATSSQQSLNAKLYCCTAFSYCPALKWLLPSARSALPLTARPASSARSLGAVCNACLESSPQHEHNS